VTYFGRGDGAADRASGGDNAPFKREDIFLFYVVLRRLPCSSSRAVSVELKDECIGTLSYALLYQYTSRSTAKTRLIDASFYFSYFISFASTITSLPCPSWWDL
jgi:hypothetical protein